jgi:hypothetical protein
MTPEELRRYHKRLLIYEVWGLTLSVQVDEAVRSHPAIQPASTPAPARRRTTAPTSQDGLEELRAVPAIAAKLRVAEEQLPPAAARYIPILLRGCARAALRPEEVAEGRGARSARTLQYIRAAARALRAVGLLIEEQGRYQVNQEELERLRSLAAVLAR